MVRVLVSQLYRSGWGIAVVYFFAWLGAEPHTVGYLAVGQPLFVIMMTAIHRNRSVSARSREPPIASILKALGYCCVCSNSWDGDRWPVSTLSLEKTAIASDI